MQKRWPYLKPWSATCNQVRMQLHCQDSTHFTIYVCLTGCWKTSDGSKNDGHPWLCQLHALLCRVCNGHHINQQLCFACCCCALTVCTFSPSCCLIRTLVWSMIQCKAPCTLRNHMPMLMHAQGLHVGFLTRNCVHVMFDTKNNMCIDVGGQTS